MTPSPHSMPLGALPNPASSTSKLGVTASLPAAAQISGNNFGSSELEYMEPKLNAQYVEEILARGQAI